MAAPTDSKVVNVEANAAMVEAIWQQIQQRLEAKKQQIYEEIKNYPYPIPACDAQYNGLLEDRALILQELGYVTHMLKQPPATGEQIELLTEFVGSSRFLTGEAQSEIQKLVAKLSILRDLASLRSLQLN